MDRGQGWLRGRAAVLTAALALALGALIALAGGGAAPARAALPCGVLGSCPTTTATTSTASASTTTATPTTTATTPAPTPTTPTVTTPAGLDAGARYDGRTREGTGLVTFTTARTGTTLSKWIVGFDTGRCSDGTPYDGLAGSNDRLTISSTGQVGEHIHAEIVDHDRDGRAVRGTARATMAARYRGGSLTGTLSDTFTGHGLSCHTGLIHFTAAVDGSPAAPLRLPYVDTGTYRGTGVGATVFLPWNLVTRLRFPVRLVCPGQKAMADTFTFVNVPVLFPQSQAFALAENRTVTVYHGIRITQIISARLSFTSTTEPAGTGRARVTYRASLRGGEEITTPDPHTNQTRVLCSGGITRRLTGPVAVITP